jgi:hypothetical protein
MNAAQTDGLPSKEEMWDRVKRLGLLGDDGLLDLARLDVLGDVPQCELEVN